MIKFNGKNNILSLLPPSLLSMLKFVKKTYNRLNYKLSRLSDPTVVYQHDIVSSLKKVGLHKGDGVMLHSSMSVFGKIDGGPQTVVDSIIEVVGDTGLIVMPSYPLTTKMKNYLDQGITFDIRSTPSKMGAITECFRKMPDVYRSIHPTHPVCARGTGAKELVAGHEYCSTPFCEGSPFDKIVNKNLYLLLFGVDFGPVTIYHVFEDKLGDKFPVNVYLDKIYNARCIRDNGSEIIVQTLSHDPKLSDIRIDNNKNKSEQFYKLLKNRGLIKEVTLGNGRIMIVGLKDLLSEMQNFLALGITIYDMEIDSCDNT